MASTIEQMANLSLLVVRGAPLPPQGHIPVSALRQTVAQDREFGGTFRIYGTVARKDASGNTPLRRRVRLHRSRDGLLVREAWSNADGTYEFRGIAGGYEYDVIAWDNEMSFRSVVANNLMPEPM